MTAHRKMLWKLRLPHIQSQGMIPPSRNGWQDTLRLPIPQVLFLFAVISALRSYLPSDKLGYRESYRLTQVQMAGRSKQS